jgi:hypothetical protein
MTLKVLDRWAEDRTERLPGHIKEVVGSGTVLLVTAGTIPTLAARRVSSALPIVFVAVDDPVAIGVMDSLRSSAATPLTFVPVQFRLQPALACLVRKLQSLVQ